MGKKPIPPVFSSGTTPDDYDMTNHIATQNQDGEYSYRLKPELINDEKKLAPAKSQGDNTMATKKSTKKPVETEVSEEKLPSFSKAALALARAMELTPEQISEEIGDNYPDLKSTDANAVRYHIKRWNKNNPEDQIEEMVKIDAPRTKAGFKVVPMSEVPEDQLPEKPSRGRPSKKAEAVEEEQPKKTKRRSKKVVEAEDSSEEEAPKPKRRVRRKKEMAEA